MKHQTLNAASTAVLLAAAVCWGTATVITKSILFSVSPITLLVTQLTFSISVLWGLVYFRGRPWPALRQWLTVGSLGLLNPGIAYTLSLIGLTTTTASIATLLWATEPVLILGMAWGILRESVGFKLISLSVMAIIGVGLMSGLETPALLISSLSGNLWILGGVLCCALYTVLMRRSSTVVEPLLAVTAQQTFALLWALAIWPFELLASGPKVMFKFDEFPWSGIALSGIMYYALAYLCYLEGLRRVEARRASIFFNLIPIVGIAGAFVFLGERLSRTQWLGASIVVLSVFALLLSQATEAGRSRTAPDSNV